MPKGRWVLRFALLALLAFAVSSTLLVPSSPALADAIGCSAVSDAVPAPGGRCLFTQDETCYECEYSYAGGADVQCSESPDGRISYCKPFRPSVNP